MLKAAQLCLEGAGCTERDLCEEKPSHSASMWTFMAVHTVFIIQL